MWKYKTLTNTIITLYYGNKLLITNHRLNVSLGDVKIFELPYRLCLICLSCLHTDKYNTEMNPDIRNVFSTAVFRFGHTLIPANMAYTNSQMEKMEYKNLADVSCVLL